MKRIVVAVLSAGLLVSAAACGVEDEGGDPVNNSSINNGTNNSVGNNSTNNGGADLGDLDDGGMDTQDVEVDDDVSVSDMSGDGGDEADFGLPPEDLGGEGDVSPEVDAGPGDVGSEDVDPGQDIGVEEDAGGTQDVGPEDVGSPDVGVDMPPAEDTGPDPDAEEDMAGPLCPPEAPFGNNVGDTLPSVALEDCDGNEVNIQSLCRAQVGWIFEFAEWCPPCQRLARNMNDLQAEYAPLGVESIVVISQNSSFRNPNQSDCQRIRDQYNLNNLTVLYDSQGTFRSALGVPANDINILTGPGAEIIFKRQYAGESGVTNAIDAELGR